MPDPSCAPPSVRLLSSWGEEHFSFLAGRFGFSNGCADIVERIPASVLGFDNSVPYEPGDGIGQLVACIFVEPGDPVAAPENFEHAATGQDVARILAYADRLAGKRSVLSGTRPPTGAAILLAGPPGRGGA
jgi:hypothetical protein